jgi:hypothetical protein
VMESAAAKPIWRKQNCYLFKLVHA